MSNMKKEFVLIFIVMLYIIAGLSGCIDSSNTIKVRVTNNYTEELYITCVFYEDAELTDGFTPSTQTIDVGDSYTYEHTFEDEINNSFDVDAQNETLRQEGTDLCTINHATS